MDVLHPRCCGLDVHKSSISEINCQPLTQPESHPLKAQPTPLNRAWVCPILDSSRCSIARSRQHDGVPLEHSLFVESLTPSRNVVDLSGEDCPTHPPRHQETGRE